jgi:PTS system nitrogen regulatory IIA component
LFDRAQVANWAAVRGLAAKAGFLAPVTPAFATGFALEPLLRAGGILRNVAAADILEIFAQVISALPGATPTLRQFLSQRIRAKGGVNIAPVGGGFALPHPSARIALGRDSGTVALILLREALDLIEPQADAIPVTRLFFFIAPTPRAHLDILGRLSRSLVRGPLREMVVRGATDEEIYHAAAEADKSVPGTAVGEVAP